MTTVFADTIVQVSLTGSLVRIDLGTVAIVNKDGKQEARLMPTQQLVMPLEGFVRGFGVHRHSGLSVCGTCHGTEGGQGDHRLFHETSFSESEIKG